MTLSINPAFFWPDAKKQSEKNSMLTTDEELEGQTDGLMLWSNRYLAMKKNLKHISANKMSASLHSLVYHYQLASMRRRCKKRSH